MSSKTNQVRYTITDSTTTLVVQSKRETPIASFQIPREVGPHGPFICPFFRYSTENLRKICTGLPRLEKARPKTHFGVHLSYTYFEASVRSTWSSP